METQKIVLFGPTTKVGESILKEALNRGHKVTAVTRDPKKVTFNHPNLKVVAADIMNKNDIISKVKGHDVVISAYEIKSDPDEHVKNTRTLIEAVNKANIRQLIIAGHPGMRELESEIPFPTNTGGWKSIAEAQTRALELLGDEKQFRWSYVHHPEIRNALNDTGKPAFGDKLLVKNSESEQWVVTKDFLQTVLNEAEHFTEAHTEL